LPDELQQLRATLRRGLEATAPLFAPLWLAVGWVHRAAHILGRADLDGAAVRKQFGGLLGGIRRQRDTVGALGGAVDHFVKVSRSYWPGLFACYDTPDLPRTNNELEQLFGSHRYHERRVSGRKGASPSLVLRGPVRLVAGLATRIQERTDRDLAQANREEWQKQRGDLEERRRRRVERRHFRRDPQGYLKALENKLIQSRLPA
jgi:hypothetical protein